MSELPQNTRVTLEGAVNWKRELQANPPKSLSYPSTWGTRKFYLEEALAGDESFADQVLLHLIWKVALDYALNENEKAYLALALMRVRASVPALCAVAGNSGKTGAPRKGYVGARAASHVMEALSDGRSLEEAIASVANQLHMSESRVSQHWNKWQDRVRDSQLEDARRWYAEQPEVISMLEEKYRKRKRGRKPGG